MANVPSWAELLGSHNWADLLDPLHPDLRNYILRCGHMVQAAYDAFSQDTSSSRYTEANLFHQTHLPFASDYTVSQLLYATATIEPENKLVSDRLLSESNFIGYIAVSNDDYARATGRREVYVSWRGTKRPHEWLNNCKFLLTSAKSLFNDFPLKCPFANPKVMEAWLSIYTANDLRSLLGELSARDQLLSKIADIVERYKDEKLSIVCVGHSLGGTLAVLSAVDIVTRGFSKIQIPDKSQHEGHFPVTAVVFGCPKIGNLSFNYQLCHLPNLKLLHVKSAGDVVTEMPLSVLNLVLKTWVVLDVNTDDTPGFEKLSIARKIAYRHNLRALMEKVKGYNGANGGFQLKMEMESYIEFVNKSCDLLADLWAADGLEKDEDDDNGGSSEESSSSSPTSSP